MEQVILDDALEEEDSNFKQKYVSSYDPSQAIIHNQTQEVESKKFKRKLKELTKVNEIAESNRVSSHARTMKSSVMAVLLSLITVIACLGLYIFLRGDDPQKKDGLSASLAAMSALAGIASGFGLK